MTAGLILIAIVVLLGVLAHRRTRFEERIFKNVPVNDWLSLIVFPPLLFMGWALVVRNIMVRRNIGVVPIDDIDFLLVMFIFFIYAFVGNSLHFVSKILWRYLHRESHYSMAYRVNEMFHGKLSHYLVYTTTFILFFLLAIFELNHPLLVSISRFVFIMIIIASIILGFSGAKSIFYTNQWFGGYNKPLYFISLFLFGILYLIFIYYHINIYLYPVTLFVLLGYGSFATAFVLRQAVIFSRLRGKNRLRFLQKILSV